jgi:hypothetical protein
MATPVHVFVEVAAKHGDVDPTDMAAVQRWYMKTLPMLRAETIRAVVEELIERDGEAPKGTYEPTYPETAPLRPLSASPPARLVSPGPLRRLLRRLFGS